MELPIRSIEMVISSIKSWLKEQSNKIVFLFLAVNPSKYYSIKYFSQKFLLALVIFIQKMLTRENDGDNFKHFFQNI